VSGNQYLGTYSSSFTYPTGLPAATSRPLLRFFAWDLGGTQGAPSYWEPFTNSGYSGQ
jgi:hypothetical protein